jgi:tyrosyl-tRNA synthetase
MPEEMAECMLSRRENAPTLVELLVSSGLAPSKSEARRLIKAGGVTVDGCKVTDPAATTPSDPAEYVLRCGKLGFRRICWR